MGKKKGKKKPQETKWIPGMGPRTEDSEGATASLQSTARRTTYSPAETIQPHAISTRTERETPLQQAQHPSDESQITANVTQRPIQAPSMPLRVLPSGGVRARPIHSTIHTLPIHEEIPAKGRGRPINSDGYSMNPESEMHAIQSNSDQCNKPRGRGRGKRSAIINDNLEKIQMVDPYLEDKPRIPSAIMQQSFNPPIEGPNLSNNFQNVPEYNSGKGRGRRNDHRKYNSSIQPDNMHLSDIGSNVKFSCPNASPISSDDSLTPPMLSPSNSSYSLNKFSLSSSDSQVVKKFQMAKRPGFGMEGTPINLITNFFRLDSKLKKLYHYDADIEENKCQKRRLNKLSNLSTSSLEKESKSVGKLTKKLVIEELIKLHALRDFHPIYDGTKNVFTTSPLPIKSKTSFFIDLNISERKKTYEVTIQPVEKKDGSNEIDMRTLNNLYSGNEKSMEKLEEISLAFNAIMNHRHANSDQVRIGRSFFYLTNTEKVSISEGIEIWLGYNQSVHFTQKGPAVVLNISAKAFHKAGPVIDYANEVLNQDITRSSLKPFEIKKLENALKGVRVKVMHLKYGRKYSIQGVSKLSANEHLIDVNGRKMSIAQYFQENYGTLKYPYLPTLHMRSNNNKTYIPLEVCVVCEGQPKIGKLSPYLQQKMIQKTAIVPSDRFDRIGNTVHNVNKECGEQMRNYDLLLQLEPMQIRARRISAPALVYNEYNSVPPDNRGVWRIDGKKFFKSRPIEKWVLLCFNERANYQDLNNLAINICKIAKNVGLNLDKPCRIEIVKNNELAEVKLRYVYNLGAIFAFIILSRKVQYHSYDEIKYISDYKLGLVTQCMDEKFLSQCSESRCTPKANQYLTNICLKINAKFGGVNHSIENKMEIFKKPLIVFGADVVHSPRGSGCPSIASVVASLDAHPSKYKLACRVQDNPDVKKISQELILELEDMVSKLLNEFYMHTKGKIPEKIIFFRDGVSEGQFEKVLQEEVRSIQNACKKVFDRLIDITFIIVQKRHQMRFLPQNRNDGIGKTGNVQPGTTVDRDITHPFLFDYYLCSHEGIQGTSKPAHYYVLYDDNKFTPDDLQKLTYHLCHMFARCNRSVSIPAPVKYADLAAYRAKKYADFHIAKDNASSSGSSNSSCKLSNEIREAINKMEAYKTDMFFI